MNRREFFKDATALTMTLAMAAGAEELFVQSARADEDEKPAGPPVNCAVIGLSAQGRDILASLAKLGNTPVIALCDTYTVEAYIKRSQEIAPNAAFQEDYRKVLDNRDVQAVFVSTPSHKHKQIVLDALAAGKHVYCEAPLASNIEEAKEIARAGAAAKTLFQSGLQYRANKQHQHVLSFVRSGALGHVAGARGQWHKKQSWRRVAPTPEREKELNWRLYKESSGGLMGEIGIHQLDTATWFLKALPVSVLGFGDIMHWTGDGMEVPDTALCIMEYPNNVRFSYDATLVDSFNGSYDVFMGSDSAMLLRDQRAWMFKETDSPLLGWEVYARKDKLGIGEDTTGTGIALVADATKLIAQGKQPGQVGTDVTKTALYQALSAFFDAIRSGKKPAAGPMEGYQATVIALKAHEAILTGNKITFQKEWFDLA